MKHSIHIIFTTLLVSTVALYAQFEGLTVATAESAIARLDLRDSFGGCVVQGVVSLSTEEGTIKCDGKSLGTAWDTTKLADGWHTLSCNGKTERVCVRNDASIRLEEGRLVENTTWNNTAVHLVRNDIYVPNGVTLTLTSGAVVKFTEDTRIIVEHGGMVSVQGTEDSPVQFALATDDKVGGDTDLRDGSMDVPSYSLIFCYNTSNGWADNGQFVLKLLSVNTLPIVSIHNSSVMEHEGVVMIPVTVSGTRHADFAVDWIAQDGTAKLNRDYKVSSGRLTWPSTDNGTGYIEIPLVKDDVTEDMKDFTVTLTTSTGTNIGAAESTVSICESAAMLPADAEYACDSIETEEGVEVDERTDVTSCLAHETEQLHYSTAWCVSNAAKRVRITVLHDAEDEEEHEIFTSIDYAEGKVEWETSDLEKGLYVIAHETLDEQGGLLERLETRFCVNHDIVVHDGCLTDDETWDDSAIHVVRSNVIVPDGVMLTISHGVIVKFQSGCGIEAKLGGDVECNGVTFTHIADDSIGGDTNMDGNATVPDYNAYTLTGFTPGADCKMCYVMHTLTGGTINGTTTLMGNCVYQVMGDITIASGGNLIVQPGTIVKMEAGVSINVNSGGTLEALGDRAQLIVFTSIKDDAHSGDTNGDGNKTGPQPGDWGRINVSGGTVNLSYSQIYYCGTASSMNDAIYMSSGSCVLENCIIAHVTQYVAGLDGGTWTMRNSVFYDFDTAFRHFGSNSNINCVFYDFGNLTNNGSMNFTNCVISNYSKALLWTNWGNESSDNSTYKNCIIWNPKGFGPQSSIKTNRNGNVWADPLFNDPDNGDFTLKSGSPCIDAGDGSVAPETDYFGQPRQDIREIMNTGTEAANGAVPDIGIHEMLPKNSKSDVDLAITDLVLSQNELEIGKEITLSWTVANLGNRATNTTWRDRVYLVTSSKKEYELGTYLHTTNIAPNGMQTVQGTFGIPLINEGTCRIRVRINSDRDIYEGSLVNNNVVYSDEVSCYIPDVEENRYDGKVLSGENILKLVLDGKPANIGRIRVPQGTIVLTGNGFVPEMNHYDSRLTSNSDELLFEIPNGCETLYLLIQASQDGPCELDLFHGDMQIGNIEPNIIPCNGMTSVVVSGVGFHDVLSVKATNQEGNVNIAAKSVRQISAEQLLVTFNCSDFSAGEQYGLLVTTETSLASVQNAFAVSRQNGEAKIVAHLSVPDTIRQGRKYVCKLEYENIGNIDALVPIFEIEVQGEGTLGVVHGKLSSVKTLPFIGAGNLQTAGVIRPGEYFAISFIYTAGRNDRLLLRSSIDKNYYASGWSNSLDFSQNVSEAAYRVGRRGQDASNYKTVIELAAKIRDGAETGGAVFGKMLDGNKMPVSEMPLSIYSDEECETLVSVTKTSANGDYCFADLEGGTYYLVPICIPQGTSASYLEKNRHEVFIAESQDVNKDIELDGGFSIAGVIDDNDSYLVALRSSSNGEQITQEVRNVFQFYGLAPGWYYLECSNEKKGQTCWIDYSDADAKMIRITPKRKYNLSGFIENYRELTEYLKNAVVCIENQDGNDVWGCLDENGNFVFEDLIAGKYTISLANCPYVGEMAIELDDDTSGVSFVATSMENDNTRGIQAYGADASVQLRSQNLWDEFWGLCKDIAQQPFNAAFEPLFDWLNDLQKPYQEISLWAYRLKVTYSVQEPSGIYDCEHNRKKYMEDKCYYDIFVLKTEYYQSIVRASNPLKAIGETGNLVATIGDVAFDYTLGKYVNGAHKWTKIGLELVAIAKSSINEISELIEYVEKLDDGTVKWTDFISQSDREFIESVTFPIEGAFISAASVERKIELITDVLKNSKRIETILNGILHQKRLMARGYPWVSKWTWFTRLEKFSMQLLSFVSDLTRLGEQAKKTAYEMTTFILSNNDLQKMTQEMREKCIDFEMRAKEFNNYPLCCTSCEPPPESVESTRTNPVQSCDPNEISGMVGVGDSGTQRFVKRGEELIYTIYFENKADAEAAAQEVRVTQELSKWLDWSTFQIVEVGFNNQIDTGLAGKPDGMSEISLDGTPWKVRSEVELNQKKGSLNCYLRIVDETTEDGWPEDPYAGFLPPNDSTHRGEGYVRYKVKVRDDAPEGAFVNAEATIVFDYNEPITTSPAWFNWVTTEENPVADNSTLRWDTSDDANGTTYVVSYWSGDPDPTAPGTTITFNSETLATGSWKLPNLYPDTYYWNVTKTHDGEPSQTSTWSFDILAYHSLTVHGGIGSGTYRTSTLVTAEANTVEGRPFIGWTASGIELSDAALSSRRLEFYMPDNDVTLTANYEELFTVTVRNGSADKVTASAGETVAITANKAAEGMAFDKWTSDDVVFADALSMRTSFTMPAKNVTVKATYREQDGIILLPGWNLIAAPGDLPVNGNEALFADLTALAFDAKSKTYVHASLPLTAGKPLWIYSKKSQKIPFVYEDTGSAVNGLTEESGWHLVGVGGEEDVLIGNVLSVWQWGHGKWSAVEIQDGSATLEAGRGYFIYKKKGEVAVMPLGWIRRYFDGEEFDWSDDTDGDGLANWEECKHGTDPVKLDTDGDGMPDGWEVQYGLNPLDAKDAAEDLDHDGFSNLSEYEKKMDPSIADTSFEEMLYVVVDLSGGPDAASYPVRYTNESPDLNDDTCRTTELWLRQIKPGTFTMGSPTNEVGRYSDETQHEVTLTQMFYIGVFECTQKQWELVMGTKPSYFNNATYYATRPVEQVSYDDIRGTNWPSSGHAVDASSFMGRLKKKTGLTFDLPTEAQWEYTCRAGTTTALNSGKNLTSTYSNTAMNKVGRYRSNGGSDCSQSCTTANGTAKVGSYQPNAWGLYDMHGNVREWCLDWYDFGYGTAAVSDPVGRPTTGPNRVRRGGSWSYYAQDCRSAYRGNYNPLDNYKCDGFRVLCLPLGR